VQQRAEFISRNDKEQDSARTGMVMDGFTASRA